jgi:hypothetical protein
MSIGPTAVRNEIRYPCRKTRPFVTLPPLDDITWKYEVEVTESDGSGSQTTHQVTMDKGYYLDLTERGRTIPEEFILQEVF